MATMIDIKKALATVEEPELHKDIVSLNMVKNITLENGVVGLLIELTTPACPMKDEIKNRIEKAVKNVAGVSAVNIEFTARVSAARPITGKMDVEGVRNV